MKTIHSRFTRLLCGGCLLAALSFARGVVADTVKLKNGTTIEGNILS